MARSDAIAANLRMISLRQIRCLVTVARTGNFSRAAEELSVSQPALSATIRQLEQRLDMTLFHRTTHKVALTEQGRLLMPHAERLLTTAHNAFVDMHAVIVRERTTVRLGVMPSAVAMVAQAVVTICDTRPDTIVHIADGRSDELLDGLRTGVYDMIVGVASGNLEGLETHLVVEDELLLVVAKGHPLADGTSQPWSALGGSEIIHFAGGSIGELATAVLHDSGLAPSPRYRVDQVESLYGLVRSGLAVGIMPRLYTQGSRSNEVSLVPLFRPAIKRKVMLMYRSQLRDEHLSGVAVARDILGALRTRDDHTDSFDRKDD
jgi:LysR family carnitine catabolism transcriptional activator